MVTQPSVGALNNTKALFFNNSFHHFSRLKKVSIVLISTMASLFLVSHAQAIAIPAAGSFAFDVYDVVVTQVLQGPIGFVGGLAVIVIGAAQLTKSWVLAILGIISGTVIIRADAIVASLGMVTTAI